MKKFHLFISWLPLLLAACNEAAQTRATVKKETNDSGFFKSSYGYDAQFLRTHTGSVLELSDPDGSAKLLLAPKYQGRVMTSTATGDTGRSFGWINYDLIRSGGWQKQFNPVGGEERFWLGPEGGQYALYFKPKDSFTFANWQVPPVIDTEAYNIVRATKTEAVFAKSASIRNYSGTTFDFDIERTIRLLDKATVESKLKTAVPAGIQFVGYETRNRLQNTGATGWTEQGGLLSIWLLGMFTPTPQTVVIIPFTQKPGAQSGITHDYFGAIPPDRLQLRDSVLVFTCDGKLRSKIGLSPAVAKPIAASFDFENNVLTLVIPEVHAHAPYVNSKWELQQKPYGGDVINAYNDGPLDDGTQMGPFYEIESSSPALQLKKGEAASYTQTTLHLTGSYAALRQLATELLHVDLDSLKR